MREAGELAASFPRPGRVLKAVLITIAVFAIVGAIVVNWLPGGRQGVELYSALAFKPQDHASVLMRPWAIVTSGVLTSPTGISHALWSIVGLYFLTPDLERRWGGARLLRFLVLSVVLGNLFVLAGTFLPTSQGVFHPMVVAGPLAAVLASTIAWAKEHSHAQVRLMFMVPISGKALLWFTLAGAALSLLFLQDTSEGVLALPGGAVAGLLLSGSPSPVRALWLRIRLGNLRRRGGGGGITVEQLLSDEPAKPKSKRGGKAPPLRVVQGGLDDELKNRKPPKDKRYLN